MTPKPVQWHIGCSGFHYPEWKGFFYPDKLPASRWFEYYTTRFNTLEVNSSFYRFPSLSMLEKWNAKAPDDFLFSFKVPRFVTHFHKFSGTQRMLNDFYQLLHEGLREKTGAVLFQLPPQISYDENFLENMLSQMNPDFRNVVEFRHESWWRSDVMKRLAQKKVVFAGCSFPGNAFDQAVVNLPVAYYRFHGVPKLFFSAYKKAFLQQVAHQLLDEKKLKAAFVYFNNTATLAALKNASTFERYLRQLANGQ